MFVVRRPSLRRRALRVLLAWLLGIVTGLAHACFVTPRSDGDSAAAAVWVQVADEAQGGASHPHRLDGCEWPPVAALAAKSVPDDVAGVVPSLFGVDPAPPAPSASLRANAIRPGRPSEPAIPIAFLRLTL